MYNAFSPRRSFWLDTGGLGSLGSDAISGAGDQYSRGRREPICLLTRGSPLALAQTALVSEALRLQGWAAKHREVITHGDRDRHSPLTAFGGFGAFVKALEEALLRGEGDAAVHSLKDVPSELPEDLVLGAILPRERSGDLLVTRHGNDLTTLPLGARVGTASPRRTAQLRQQRADLVVVPLRGNLDTRLEKLFRGDVDALVVAEAGLHRLGKTVSTAVSLPFLPAPGQGAVAVEIPKDSLWKSVVASLDHLPTRHAVTAERAFLRALGAGCRFPVAAHACWIPGDHPARELELRVELWSEDGTAVAEGSQRKTVPNDAAAEALGTALWRELALSPLVRSWMAHHTHTPPVQGERP